MRTLQVVNLVSSVIGVMACCLMSQELAKRNLWKGRAAYLIVAGAYLSDVWFHVTYVFGYIPWSGSFLRCANSIALMGFALYLQKHYEFFDTE